MSGHGRPRACLPASYYLDDAAFRRERERLLFGEWFCAGRADQVERPGSLVVVDVAGESVLLARSRVGELRAHYNVCRHRGSQVVPCPPAEPGTPQASPPRKAGSLRCPYPSWAYRLEGDLLGAPWSEEIDGLDQEAFGLHPVGVATWGGFVFLHLTPCFRPADPDAFAVGRFPVWIWMDDPSFYGFPVWPGAALKAAQDVGGPQVTATTRGFDPDPAAAARPTGFLRQRLPAAVGAPDHSATCLYTLTPDRDFALGPVPGQDRVLVALGAAHGFKFTPLLGRVLADLALHGGIEADITPFALDRPALTAPAAQANYLV